MIAADASRAAGFRRGEDAHRRRVRRSGGGGTAGEGARLRRLTSLWLADQDDPLAEYAPRRDRGADRAQPDPGAHPCARVSADGAGAGVFDRGARVDGEVVEIEADITSGLPGVHLVGLADAALQESRDRVRSAITNSGNQWPMSRLTLALSPATLPKMGRCTTWPWRPRCCRPAARSRGRGWKRPCCWANWRSTAGCVRCAACCPQCWPPAGGWPTVVVPMTNLAEASLVDGVEVLGVANVGPVAAGWKARPGLRSGRRAHRPKTTCTPTWPTSSGQTQARFVVEVAAAGAHHLMLTGPPGIGKTMLAQRLPGLLPPLTESRGARGDRDPLGGRDAGRRHAVDHPAAVRRPAPHLQCRRTRRRRHRHGAPRCGQSRTPRRAVPRRMRRDRGQRAGSVANAVGGRRDPAGAP